MMDNYKFFRKMAGYAAVLALSVLPQAVRAQNAPATPPQDQTQTAPAPAQQPKHHGGDMAGLNLTNDQKAQIKQIRQDTKSKMDALNNDSTLTPDAKAAQAKQLRRAAHKQIRGILTPEQRQAMRARARARREAAAPQPS